MAKDNHNITAEQSVIGTLMRRPEAFDDLGDLSASDFWLGEHRVIYETLSLMLMAAEPVDIVTLDAKLTETGRIKEAGGFSYLAEIDQNTPSTLNAKRYAKIVKDYAVVRALNAAGAEVQKIADEEGSIEEKVAKAQQAIMDIALEQTAGNEPVSIQQIAIRALRRIDGRMKGEQQPGVMTGFEGIDRLLGGLQPGNMYVLAGRPGSGKTTLATNILERATKFEPGLFISREMTDTQIGDRAIASLGSLNLESVQHGTEFTDTDLEQMNFAAANMHQMKLFVDFYASTPEAVAVSARRIKRKHGLGLLVIDYLGLLHANGSNKNEEVSNISASCKSLAKSLNVPVLVLCQLNRGVEQRPDKRPLMSDLRDSGSIEQDADVVLMTYRDEYYFPDNHGGKGWAEVIVRKNRMGALGTVLLQFQGHHSRFVNPAKGTEHQYQPYTGKTGGKSAGYSGGFD